MGGRCHGPQRLQNYMSRFLPATIIASANGVTAKTVHRQARRERWPLRRQGNRVKYIAPRGMLKAVNVKASPLDQPRLLRELLRAAAVAAFILEMQRNPKCGIERALSLTSEKFPRVFEFSPRALRRWVTLVEADGITALQEHKAGIVGRKSTRLERLLR